MFYEYSNEARNFRSIKNHLAVTGYLVDCSQIHGFLQKCLNIKLMVCEEERFLSLALPV